MVRTKAAQRGGHDAKSQASKSRAIKRRAEDVVPDTRSPPNKKSRKAGPDKAPAESPPIIKRETQECAICIETKPVYRNFPTLSICSHPPTVCSECYERHFINKINDDREAGWSSCTCPLCDNDVPPEEAQAILPRHLSKEINTMIKNAQTHTAQNWIWCPGPGCGQGQLHQPKKNVKVSCKACGLKICYNHQIKFHDGLTCVEYDMRGNKNLDEVNSLKEIQRTTKPCPHCKTRIKKEGGCNHMTCTGCHKHWLWDTVPFDGEKIGTTAEVKGGPAGAAPLQAEARQIVEQVIQFQNNGGNPLPQGPGQVLQQDLAHLREQIVRIGVQTPRNVVPREGIPNAPRVETGPRNPAELFTLIVNGANRAVGTLLQLVAPNGIGGPRRDIPNGNGLTTITRQGTNGETVLRLDIDVVPQQTQQINTAMLPVPNPGPAHHGHQQQAATPAPVATTASARARARTRTRTRTRPQATIAPHQPNRQIARRNNPRRNRVRHPTIIDLTQEEDVVDLTADD